MFNMMSVWNMLFVGIYKLTALSARLSGHQDFSNKMEKRAKRCNEKILFYEGQGPWPEKL